MLCIFYRFSRLGDIRDCLGCSGSYCPDYRSNNISQESPKVSQYRTMHKPNAQPDNIKSYQEIIIPICHISRCDAYHISLCDAYHISLCDAYHISLCDAYHISLCGACHISLCDAYHISLYDAYRVSLCDAYQFHAVQVGNEQANPHGTLLAQGIYAFCMVIHVRWIFLTTSGHESPNHTRVACDEGGIRRRVVRNPFLTLMITLLSILDIRKWTDVIKPGMERSQARSDRYFVCASFCILSTKNMSMIRFFTIQK